MSEAEHAKKVLKEELAMKATEEKEAAEKTKPPVLFEDAVGRKFSFPFHLVQTWEGMEDLIKQACLRVGVNGPQVQEGRFDLEDSEGQIILPSLWSTTIKPGDSVIMRMWPKEEIPQYRKQVSPFPERPMQGGPSLPVMPLDARFSPPPLSVGIPNPAPTLGGIPALPEAIEQGMADDEARQRALEHHHDEDIARRAVEDERARERLEHYNRRQAEVDRLWQERLNREAEARRLDEDARQREADARRDELRRQISEGQRRLEARRLEEEAHQREDESRRSREVKYERLPGGAKRSKKDGKDKHKHSKTKTAESRDDREPEDSHEGEDAEDIDQELGLDDLEGAEEMAAKDIDELLETWTNVGGGT